MYKVYVVDLNLIGKYIFIEMVTKIEYIVFISELSLVSLLLFCVCYRLFFAYLLFFCFVFFSRKLTWKVNPTVPFFVFVSTCVEYFLNMEHCKHPHININRNRIPDVIVSRIHWFIPSSIHMSVKFNWSPQYNILVPCYDLEIKYSLE